MRGQNQNFNNQTQFQQPQAPTQPIKTDEAGFVAEDVRVTCVDEDYQVKELETFEECNFRPEFYNIIFNLKFKAPTPIQKYAIPIAMDNKDLIGIAKTGSGKTLAFMLPAIMSILDEKEYFAQSGKFVNNRFTPMALILAPTRELANQIYEASYQFASRVGVQVKVVYGGQDIYNQKKKLKEGVDILIGTPGRLIDLIERESLNLSRVFYFVLDEADRMLDMGFMPQVKSIIRELPKDRQTLMWSATWPKEVES